MKKVILTSATVLFLALTAVAQDGGKCCKKGDKKCEMAACTKDEKCKEKCTHGTADAHCKKETKACCKKAEDKKSEVK